MKNIIVIPWKEWCLAEINSEMLNDYFYVLVPLHGNHCFDASIKEFQLLGHQMCTKLTLANTHIT